MDIIITIILGIVQGATEFLPVSSSGHLVIAGRLLGSTPSFEFDVLVNFGTLLAMMIYFRVRIVEICRDILQKRRFDTLAKLALATIPAVAVGFTLQPFIEQHLHNTWIVALMLAIVGVLMVISRWWQPNTELPVNNDVRDISGLQALCIGLVQCFSLISGSSRSGVTMLAGLRLGLTKEKAAEWSFLMGMPIILGASLRVLFSQSGMAFIQEHTGAFLIANAASFISGLLAVSVLIKLLKRYGLYWFGIYRLVLAAVLIVLLSVNII